MDHTRRGQLAMALWITLLSFVPGVLGFWLIHDSLIDLAARHQIRLAFVLLCVGFVLLWVALRGFVIVADLLRRRTTARLAQRDFRNSLSNILMGVKTGMWKE